MTTRNIVTQLKETGMRPIEIAKEVGITKQRVSQILHSPKPKRRQKHLQSLTLETKPVLTPREVAQFLCIHINTVRRWSNEGRLKSFRISPRGDRRFLRSEINRFIGEGT